MRNVLDSGCTFPVRTDLHGGIASSSYEKSVEESIRIILGTTPGERSMRPDFGCKIDDILFALDSSKTMSLAEHYKVLKDWWKTVERGNPEQKSVSIVFMDRDGVTEIQRRNLFNCVPCAWSMSDLGSGEQGVNQETILIVYENAEWA